MKIKLLKKLRKNIFIKSVYTPIGVSRLLENEYNFIITNKYLNNRWFRDIQNDNSPIHDKIDKSLSFKTRKEAVVIRRKTILFELYYNYSKEFNTNKKER